MVGEELGEDERSEGVTFRSGQIRCDCSLNERGLRDYSEDKSNARVDCVGVGRSVRDFQIRPNLTKERPDSAPLLWLARN